MSLNAKDLLDTNHPVHKHFKSWLGDKEATRRQARRFLQEFPKYRGEYENVVCESAKSVKSGS